MATALGALAGLTYVSTSHWAPRRAIASAACSVSATASKRAMLVAMVRRELESLHNELKIHPVEELELTGEKERWISVKALREVEQPDTPTQKLPIQPEGTAEVNVARELDKLLPAEAREIERHPDTAPLLVRIFVSYAHDDERQLKRLDAMLDVLEQYHALPDATDKKDLVSPQACSLVPGMPEGY